MEGKEAWISQDYLRVFIRVWLDEENQYVNMDVLEADKFVGWNTDEKIIFLWFAIDHCEEFKSLAVRDLTSKAKDFFIGSRTKWTARGRNRLANRE